MAKIWAKLGEKWAKFGQKVGDFGEFLKPKWRNRPKQIWEHCIQIKTKIPKFLRNILIKGINDFDYFQKPVNAKVKTKFS